MKKILFHSLVFTLLLLPLITFAATGYQPLSPVPGLTEFVGPTNPNETANLANYLGALYNFLVGAAAALAVIVVIWGGFEYMTTDAIGHKEEGKQKIQNAVLGLLLALGSYIILKTINADLLSLSFEPNLDKIEVRESAEVVPIGTPNTTKLNDGSYLTTTPGGASVNGKPIFMPGGF